MTNANWLSVIAIVLSSLVFLREGWRTWRDRPRLRFYVRDVTFKNVPGFGEMKMIQILISNVGHRPIVLVRFRAFGQTSAFSMGIDDEPAAALGIADQRFPSKIDPGETLTIHPLGRAALERNQTDPEDEKTHFDPWLYFIFEDSFGRHHPIDVGDVLSQLRIGTSWRRPKGIAKLRGILERRLFLRKAKKRFRSL